MTERLIEKLDRLGAEAEIKEVTPEIRRFAMLVRQDVVAGWPKREWVGLTYEEVLAIGRELGLQCRLGGNPNIDIDYARAIEAKLKEKNEM